MTAVFENMDSRDQEEIVFCRAKDTGLKAIIALHNNLLAIFKKSQDDEVTTHSAVLKVAESRMMDIAKLKNIYLSKKNVMFKRDKN